MSGSAPSKELFATCLWICVWIGVCRICCRTIIVVGRLEKTINKCINMYHLAWNCIWPGWPCIFHAKAVVLTLAWSGFVLSLFLRLFNHVLVVTFYFLSFSFFFPFFLFTSICVSFTFHQFLCFYPASPAFLCVLPVFLICFPWLYDLSFLFVVHFNLFFIFLNFPCWLLLTDFCYLPFCCSHYQSSLFVSQPAAYRSSPCWQTITHQFSKISLQFLKILSIKSNLRRHKVSEVRGKAGSGFNQTQQCLLSLSFKWLIVLWLVGFLLQG